jgi:Rrf2 family transcriptional regulator, nitric oxide-sensitive transcriptional repressor
MYLTQFSDIGLRLLMYLAREYRETPAVTIAEVSTQLNIPRNHLVKVAGRLTQNGCISATRGRTGGIRLAVEPSALLLGDVVKILEGRKEIINCEQLKCGLRSECGLRSALSVAYDAFYSTLNTYTLADILGGFGGEELSRLHKGYLEIYLNNSMTRVPKLIPS